MYRRVSEEIENIESIQDREREKHRGTASWELQQAASAKQTVGNLSFVSGISSSMFLDAERYHAIHLVHSLSELVRPNELDIVHNSRSALSPLASIFMLCRGTMSTRYLPPSFLYYRYKIS